MIYPSIDVSVQVVELEVESVVFTNTLKHLRALKATIERRHSV
jgi:hypothetical protein